MFVLEHIILYRIGDDDHLIIEQKRLDVRTWPHETASHRMFRIRRRVVN